MTRPMIALATSALAPLGTFVGKTTADGVAGALTVDPAQPQAASDSVKIEMPDKPIPARVRGVLTVKQRPVERVADTTVTWLRLTPKLLIFKVSNENRLETDLAFARQ